MCVLTWDGKKGRDMSGGSQQPIVKAKTRKQHMNTSSQRRVAPLYEPSVFRFQCHGALYASSHSLDNHKSKISSGTASTSSSSSSSSLLSESTNHFLCRGLQTRLQHEIELQRTTSKQDAAMQFVHAAEFTRGKSPALARSLSQQATTNTPRSSDDKKRLQQDLDDWKHTNGIVLQTSFDEDESSSSPSSTSSSSSPSFPYCDLLCFGSTTVYLLVVRDVHQQKDEVVGVVPDCKLGYSIKEVALNETQLDRFDTAHLIASEIMLKRQFEFDNDDIADSHRIRRPTKENDNNDDDKREQENMEANVATKDDARLLKNVLDAEKQLQEGSNVDDADKSGDPQSNPNRPGTKRTVSLVEAPARVYHASSRIARAMKTNATILKDTLNDDFASRMVDSGQRIVVQFGRTYDRTTRLMHSVYKLWRGN